MLARHLIYLLLFTYNCCYALIDKPKITSYIINLDRSKDRLAYVQPRVNALGYPVVRFPAVDGYNLTKETLSRVVSKNFYSYTGDYADLGTIGCALSHAKVWERFLATDADYALIFEDDDEPMGEISVVVPSGRYTLCNNFSFTLPTTIENREIP